MEDQRYRLSEVLDREAMGRADHIPASLRHSGNSHEASPLHAPAPAPAPARLPL